MSSNPYSGMKDVCLWSDIALNVEINNINENPTRYNSMQSDLFYCKITLHVLGVHRTHHREY